MICLDEKLGELSSVELLPGLCLRPLPSVVSIGSRRLPVNEQT